MSNTPRTDVMVTGNCTPTQDEYEDLAAFTRQLERESEALRKLLKKCRKALIEVDGFDDDHLPLIAEIAIFL
jgi:hypothetical protein